MNDDKYPNWAGVAIGMDEVADAEENLDCLRLPISEQRLMDKYFDLEKLARELRTGSTRKPVP